MIVNKTAMLFLCWKLITSDEQWALMCRKRFFITSSPIKHHIASSIWLRLKPFVQPVLNNSNWNIGNVENVLFWKDMWPGEPLVQSLSIPTHLHA